MVERVSGRAGVRPHILRRGFANAFLRATRERFGTADVWTLQLLMGHARIDTTERYLKDLESDDAANVLRRLRAEELSQSRGAEVGPRCTPRSRLWRRRESNPRPRTHRCERLQA
jgi:hypothetical protein